MSFPSPLEITDPVSGEAPSGEPATGRGEGVSAGSTIDTDREEYVTLARVGFAFAVVRAARELLTESNDSVHWFGLRKAIADLDALDAMARKQP